MEDTLNQYLIKYVDGAVYTMRCRSDLDALKLTKICNELSVGDDLYRVVSVMNIRTRLVLFS